MNIGRDIFRMERRRKNNWCDKIVKILNRKEIVCRSVCLLEEGYSIVMQ